MKEFSKKSKSRFFQKNREKTRNFCKKVS